MPDIVYEFDEEGHTISKINTRHNPEWGSTHCRDSGVRVDGGKDA
jgi:hypothetical protein